MEPSCSSTFNSVVNYFMAIRLNKFDELSQLLCNDSSLVTRISLDGYTGLHLACKYGLEDIAEVLLDHQIRIDISDQKYDRNFLHWACIQGHNGILLMVMRKRTIDLSCIVNKLDKEGHTPIMLAVKSGRVETTRLLVTAGARTDIKTLKAGAQVTVFDMCNKSSELAQLLSETTKPAEPGSEKSIVFDGLVWGFSSNVGVSVSKLAKSKSKYIAQGWVQQQGRYHESVSVPLLSDADHSNSTLNKRAAIIEVIVKLNKDPRELEQELAVRSRLLMRSYRHADHPSSGTASTTVLETAAEEAVTVGGTMTSCLVSDIPNLTTSERASENDYFVQAVHTHLLTVPSQPDIWHAILLEKGIIDVHHLYDSMCQKATYSRLQDVRWKFAMAQRICEISKLLISAGEVWYDLKPSNFIVFPASCDGDSMTGTTPVKANNSLHTAFGTKTYKWLQKADWGVESFVIKATDLFSVYSVDARVCKSRISCTAKFLCPSLAQAFADETVREIVVSPAHMMWSLGMTLLQLLHSENKTFYGHFEIGHAEQVYAFLRQDCEALQQKVHNYVDDLVCTLEAISATDRETLLCALKGILQVSPVGRLNIEKAFELLCTLS